MRIKEGYKLIEIIGEWVVVPNDDKVLDFNKILTLSESAAFLWNKLQDESNVNELILLLLAEYEIDSNTAEIDVNTFIADLSKIGLLQE